MGMKFERENRYIVIKLKDIEEFDSDIDQKFPVTGPDINEKLRRKIYRYVDEIDGILGMSSRAEKTKNRECVVVESDWPEYEQVWAMIERRMSGGE